MTKTVGWARHRLWPCWIAQPKCPVCLISVPRETIVRDHSRLCRHRHDYLDCEVLLACIRLPLSPTKEGRESRGRGVGVCAVPSFQARCATHLALKFAVYMSFISLYVKLLRV